MLGKSLIKAATGAGGAAGAALYIEDVMSTWLYTGNGSTQTITNGIDLAGEGGLVWCKMRNPLALVHVLTDTERGANKRLLTNSTQAEDTVADITGFTSSGFTIGSATGGVNYNTGAFASWTFRKAEKFFDVVTYTGTGANRTVAHNLDSVPGCIIVKRTDTTGDWQVYHRSLANTEYMVLNSTAAKATGATRWNSTTPTSTVFSLGTDATVNASGGTYVAYLFAHDAGGFGDAGTESVIKCGSYVGNSSYNGPEVDLEWEPQWILIKNTSNPGSIWCIFDAMRGIVTLGPDALLQAQAADGEYATLADYLDVLPTGFKLKASGGSYGSTQDTHVNFLNNTYIYIAIRRGPMKTPTDATKVFAASTASTGNNTPGFTTDNLWTFYRGGTPTNTEVRSRLQGNTPYLVTSSTAAEATGSNYKWDTNNGVNYTWGSPYIGYYFRRAPGFFDVVAYTGTGVARTVPHNLGVAPELMIVKRRDVANSWLVYTASTGATQYLALDSDLEAQSSSLFWNDTAPSAAVFTVGTANSVNFSGSTYIAYLFATCPGVSKVGGYTGTGATLQVDCGFASGARFVLIKRTDSSGDWYVWDTARGIVSGNDPYLLLNSSAAEVTSTDYIDPYSAGFEISSTAPAAINASGGSFIYLSIA